MAVKHVVVIGGGNGTFWISAAKLFGVEILVIVTTFDEGGSTGEALMKFGVRAPSDFIRNIVWLHGRKADHAMLKMLDFRFSRKFGIGNFSLATLMFSGLIMANDGNLEKSLWELHYTLDVFPHRVIPVSLTPGVRIKAVYRENPGGAIVGEKEIDLGVHMSSESDYIQDLSLIGSPEVNVEALRAIRNADGIVIGPGSMHTSILPNLLVPGLADEIDKTSIPIVYVTNLTSTYGDTHGMNASGHLRLVNKHLGKRKVTHCIVNSDTDYPEWVIRKYRDEGGDIVPDNFDHTNSQGASIVRADVYSRTIHKQPENDETPRSALKHDPEELTRVIFGPEALNLV